MFGLNTIKLMNKRAAAQLKGDKSSFCNHNPLPKSEAKKVKEFEQKLHSQAPCCPTPDVEICSGQDFVITSKGPNGGLMVTPHTDAARTLLKRMFTYCEDYRGASVMLKHRDLPSLLFTINTAGLTALRL
jgi:hypothetical protein